MQWAMPKVVRWGEPNLMCSAKEKMFETIPNDKMNGPTKS
jgi:hypothetical protein